MMPLLRLFVGLVVVLTSCIVNADDKQMPKRLLFIGNSLTASNDLPSLVQQLFVTLNQPKPFVEAVVMPGSSLGDHWRNNPKLKQIIIEGKWDYIILQQGPSSLAASQKELLQDMATAKPWLKQSKAKTCLFMVWPDTSRHRFFPQVRDAYANAAKAVDGVFLPAGLALQYIRDEAPAVALFTDGLHPNQLGTYVAAYVIAAKLTGAKPEQLPARCNWLQNYQVSLAPKEHQLCIKAVKAALEDDGK